MDIQYSSIDKLSGIDFMDFKIQYLKLLSYLSISPNISESLFFRNLSRILSKGIIIIAFVKDKENKIKIIGTGTIFLEPKISHGGKNVGHIEDIIVDKEYRGKGIAKNIIKLLIEYAKNNNCYKTVLTAKESLKDFYKKLGFNESNFNLKMSFN